MTNKPKAIGTAAETAVVRVLRANGFPNAERRVLKGKLDEGDITGTINLCWEVKGGQAAKAASDAQIEEWIGETLGERDNAHADVGILVVQRKGVGPANADRWWAYLTADALADLVFYGPGMRDAGCDDSPAVRLRLCDLLPILRAAGYGDPLEEAS